MTDAAFGVLDPLGWTPDLAAAFAAQCDPGDVPGRIVLEHNHVYRVRTPDGEQLAEVAGRLRHRAVGRHDLPAVGDWVVVRPDAAGGRGQIRALLPRRSAFSRKVAGRETEPQVVAANIDVVFVVFGLDAGLNLRRIDRYLVVARHSGAEAVVVFNKADLIDDVDAVVAHATSAAGSSPVVAVSTHSGRGLDRLAAFLGPGRTVALIGPSGAGKSSIVNRLVGREALPTGDVRDWDARGRHTSVHRQLVVREQGGLVIDTPGMRELQLWETDAVAGTFGDVADLAVDCRFRDCRHETEPGCAVKAAVAAGTLDAGRLDSYRTLQLEQEAIERKRDERLLLESKRQARVQQRTPRTIDRDRHRDRRGR